MNNVVVNPQVPAPDYSTATAIEDIHRLHASEEIVVMLMVPEMFGGETDERNMLFVPPFADEARARFDLDVVRPFAERGDEVDYSVEPVFAGDSLVPTEITVFASTPEAFTLVIKIWGEAALSAEAAGAPTA